MSYYTLQFVYKDGTDDTEDPRCCIYYCDSDTDFAAIVTAGYPNPGDLIFVKNDSVHAPFVGSTFYIAVDLAGSVSYGRLYSSLDRGYVEGVPPTLHHLYHEASGPDEIKLDNLGTPDDNTDLNASTTRHGLLRKLSGITTEYLDGSGAWSTPPGGGGGAPTDAKYIVQQGHASLSAEQALDALATGLLKNTTGTGVLSIGVADTDYAAATHATRHKSGGADSIKLDELAAPTDITTLNATTGAHGLLPKLGGGTSNFLRADGTWAAPGAGGGQPIGMTTIAAGTLALALATNINIQTSPSATGTFTTTVPAAGTRCVCKIIQTNTTAKTMTFGSGFKPSATLALGTTANRFFCVEFISDETNLCEVGRTGAIPV